MSETGRARLALDFARYAIAAASAAPRTLFSVARGRMEPDIPDDGDFGRMRSRRHRVATAGSVDALRRLLAEAYAANVPVTCSGSRHSANGQTLPGEGGLRIQLDRESGGWTPPTMLDAEHVQVSAAHTWRTLQRFLRERGRSCTVLTDHLTTTIGGTLSVGGGIGTSSVAFGRQLDSVVRFRLILPDGAPVWCSPSENPGLFRHAMGGMGELGVIDEVTLRTRPYRPWLAIHRFQARSPRGAMTRIHQVLTDPRRPDNLTHLVVEGPVLETPFIQFELGFEFDARAVAQANLRRPPAVLRPLAPVRRILGPTALVAADQSNDRHNRSAAFVAALRNHRHLWNDYFFADFDAYARFLDFAQTRVLAGPGRRHLLSGLAFAYPGDPLDPVDPAHRRAAFSYPCRPASDWRWSFGFNYSVPDGPQVAQTVEALDTLRREATRLGGGVYGYGYDQRTTADLVAAYGPIVDDFRALKRRVDPKGLHGGALPLGG